MKQTKAVLTVFAITLLCQLQSFAGEARQLCVMPCHNRIELTLDQQCEAIVTWDLMIVDTVRTRCAGPYSVEVQYESTRLPIPTSPYVTEAEIGVPLVVVVTDIAGGNHCWGYLDVEDKTDPQITSCDNQTLPCSVNLADTATYGITATDACGTVELQYRDSTVMGDCNDPYYKQVFRFWTAIDPSGNDATCLQVFTLNRVALNDLIFPPNYDGVGLPPLYCEDKEPDPGNNIITNIGWNSLPNGHPSPDPVYYPSPNADSVKWFGTGRPAGGCSNVQMNFEDQRIDLCNNGVSDGCFKVLRRWILTDWCNGDILDSLQIIKVLDTLPPQINDIADITISTNSHSCLADWDITIPSLNDQCGNNSNLEYRVVASTGTIRLLPTGGFRIENLPLGMHQVTYLASDCCGNESDSTIQITVIDGVPPTAVCDGHTQASLVNDGTAKIFATTFDDISHDNCGEVYFKAIRMSELNGTINGDVNAQAGTCNGINSDDDPQRPGAQIYFDDYIRFCCDDTDSASIRVVTRVFDQDPGTGPVAPERMEQGGDLYGRFDDCMVEVTIVDKRPPTISCPANITLNCTEDFTDIQLTGTPVVSDNCSLDTTFYTDNLNLNNCNVGEVYRQWTTVDHNGLEATCTQVILLQDTTAPIISFPPDVDVSCGESDDPSNTGEPMVTADCELFYVNYTDKVFWFQDSCLRKVLRTWSLIDWCSGEEFTNVQAIKEIDDEPPVFDNVPEDTLVDCHLIPALPVITATDGCDNDVMITFEQTTIDSICPGTYTLKRIWTASDNCNNIAIDSQTVQVVDTTPPALTGVPMDVTVDCHLVPAVPLVIATDFCDPAPNLQFSETTTDSICSGDYTLTRRWIAMDNCGNVIRDSQTIVVIDTIPPSFSNVPGDTTLNCDLNVPPVDPNISDLCDGNPTLLFREDRMEGNCTGNFTITRTWIAMDNCGNEDSVKQVLTFIDTIPPDIGSIPMDTTVECDNIPMASTTTVTDNCDPTPELLVVDIRTNGRCPNEYTLLRTWIASDSCGNMDSVVQTITVIDTTAPVLIGIPNDTTISCDQSFPFPVVTATDNCQDSVEVIFDRSLPTGPCDGTEETIFTYTATDSCGNTAVGRWRVMIIDTIAPELILPADTTVSCERLFTVDTATASDNCTGVILSFQDDTLAGPCINESTIQRIYTASDSCGNMAVDTQFIMLIDTTAPVFVTVPNDTTISCEMALLDFQVTAIDNCDDSVSITRVITPPGAGCNPTAVYTWIATDNCGNQDSVKRMITLIDTIPPLITGVPDDITVNCDSIVPVPVVMASDFCDDNPRLDFESSVIQGNCEDNFILIRIWVARDTCGNMARDSQVITYIDNIAPVIGTIPADTLVECDNIPTAPTNIPVTDNCDPNPSLSVADTRTDGDCPGRFVLTRVWTAMDRCSNISRDTQLITVVDTTAPVIMGIPMDTTVVCDDIPEAPRGVTASDNCDTDVAVAFSETVIDSICTGTYTLLRIWSAMDSCSNATADTQRVFVLDTLPPTLQMPLADTSVVCNAIPDTLMIDDIRATDNCGKDLSLMVLEDTTAFGCAGTFTLERIYLISDNCGNTVRDTQLIEVIDTIPPMFTTTLADTTILCDRVSSLTDEPTATDDCGAGVAISLMADTIDRICTDEYTLLRIWTATDSCGNMARDTQLIMVIDTIAPVFSMVPGDTTVLCGFVPDPPTTIQATDNCDTMVTITLVADTTAGQCLDEFIIQRTWTATDNCDNSTQVSQTITVIDTLPPVLSTPPADTTVNCDQVPPAPVLGVELTATDNCDTAVNIVLLQDTIDRICTNGYTVRRIWVATDNCNNTDTTQQLITVIDTVAPILTCSIFADSFLIFDDSRCDTLIEINTTLIENCTDLTGLNFYYEADFNSDGNVDTSGNERTPQIRYPINVLDSVHTFRLRVTDDCGNSDSCSVQFSILDFIGPTIVCTSPVVYLDSMGNGFLLASQVVTDADDCSTVDTLFFTDKVEDTLFVDCDDLFDPRVIVRVDVTAQDSFGNPNSCRPRLVVLDTFDICPNNITSSISGTITTVQQDGMPDIEIHLIGQVNLDTKTGQNGSFLFNHVPINTQLDVEPEKNTDHRNGVSTFDLVLISKHITGQQPLGSPYKQIAADINNSGNISTFDIIELRKLILYIDTAFAHNTSWRFIRSDYLFPTNDNPFNSPFPEVYQIDNLTAAGMQDVNFMGIKIGDVNGSARTNFGASAQTRSYDGLLSLEVVNTVDAEGKEIRRSIRVAEDVEVYGYQFALEFDPQLLSWKGISEKSLAAIPGLSKANFNTDLINRGVLLTSWAQGEVLQLKKGTELFELIFTGKEDHVAQLSLSNEWLSAEVYLEDGQVQTLQLREESPALDGYQLFQNRPNPFAQTTLIGFELPKACRAELNIYDAAGRLVKQFSGDYTPGYHELQVEGSELSGGTLFFYQLKTPEFTATRKMVLQ